VDVRYRDTVGGNSSKYTCWTPQARILKVRQAFLLEQANFMCHLGLSAIYTCSVAKVAAFPASCAICVIDIHFHIYTVSQSRMKGLLLLFGRRGLNREWLEERMRVRRLAECLTPCAGGVRQYGIDTTYWTSLGIRKLDPSKNGENNILSDSSNLHLLVHYRLLPRVQHSPIRDGSSERICWATSKVTILLHTRHTGPR